jgi:hypothetical protein
MTDDTRSNAAVAQLTGDLSQAILSATRSNAAVAQLIGDLSQAILSAYADLRDAVELMDTKITPYGEREDGTTANYIVADSTWHRVLSIARGSTSDAARKALDEMRATATDDAGGDALSVADIEQLATNVRTALALADHTARTGEKTTGRYANVMRRGFDSLHRLAALAAESTPVDVVRSENVEVQPGASDGPDRDRAAALQRRGEEEDPRRAEDRQHADGGV